MWMGWELHLPDSRMAGGRVTAGRQDLNPGRMGARRIMRLHRIVLGSEAGLAAATRRMSRDLHLVSRAVPQAVGILAFPEGAARTVAEIPAVRVLGPRTAVAAASRAVAVTVAAAIPAGVVASLAAVAVDTRVAAEASPAAAVGEAVAAPMAAVVVEPRAAVEAAAITDSTR